MKKCPLCSKEYPDDAGRCAVDDELLLGEALAAPTGAEIAVQPSSIFLADRQIRVAELVLVCVIAFGGALLASTYSFFNPGYGSSGRSELAWEAQIMRELSALGLVWYVLLRRQKSFSDLGLTWAWSDAGWSVLLKAGESLAFYVVFHGIIAAGLSTVNVQTAAGHVNQILFGGGIFLVTILFQFLNPFFEELIVRAYVMTEVKQLTGSATMAVIISTALQTSYHFYQGAPAALGHGAAFLIFSVYYAKTNRIAPVILAHLYSDVGGTLWYMYRQ